MKLAEAELKIKKGLKKGFIIRFQKLQPGGTSEWDRIPEFGENLFKTVNSAWTFAEKLAKVSKGEYLNFHITTGQHKKVDDRVIVNG